VFPSVAEVADEPCESGPPRSVLECGEINSLLQARSGERRRNLVEQEIGVVELRVELFGRLRATHEFRVSITSPSRTGHSLKGLRLGSEHMGDDGRDAVRAWAGHEVQCRVIAVTKKPAQLVVELVEQGNDDGRRRRRTSGRIGYRHLQSPSGRGRALSGHSGTLAGQR